MSKFSVLGTLTQNKLQMREPWVISKEIDANEIGFLSALASKRVNPDAIDFCVINGNFFLLFFITK